MNLLKLGKAMLEAAKVGVKQLIGKEAKQDAVQVAEHAAETTAAKAPQGLGEKLKEAATSLRQKLSRNREGTPHAAAPEIPAAVAAKPATPEAAAQSLREKVGAGRQKLETENPGMTKPGPFKAPNVQTPEQAGHALGDMAKAVKNGDLNRVKGNAVAVLDSPEGAKNARRISDNLMEARKAVTDPAERKQISALLHGSQKKQVDMMVTREAQLRSGRFHADEVQGIVQTNLREAQHVLASGANPKNAGDSLKLASESLQRLKKIDPKAAEAELHKFSPAHQGELSKLMAAKPATPQVAPQMAQPAAKPHPFADQLGIHRPPPTPAAPAVQAPPVVTTAGKPTHVAPQRPAVNDPAIAQPQREAAFAPPEKPVVVPEAGGPVRSGQEIKPFEFADKPTPATSSSDLPYTGRPVLSDGVDMGRLNASLADKPAAAQGGVSGVDAMRQKIEALAREGGVEEVKLGGAAVVPHGGAKHDLMDLDLPTDVMKPMGAVRRGFPTLGGGG